MFSPDTWKLFENHLGAEALRDLRNVHYAIVHRYESNDPVEGNAQDVESDRLVRNVAACLRLIRPMRQPALLMRGVVGGTGTIGIAHFEHPANLLEVPEVQKLFHLRTRDVEELQARAPEFLRLMAGPFWKFRMSVEFHEAGHFQGVYWKARYLLWCSALEAIYTSNEWQHRGSLVAKERIKWFLGAQTPIYAQGDIPDYIQQPDIRIATIVDDVYRVRNFIAHGDRIPDEYFQRALRQGLNGPVNALSVLTEAVSFIVRKSLLKILNDQLLNHFASADASETYYAAQGLTLDEIRRRQQRVDGDPNDE